jgi:ATP-dependent DNA helicase PIF1
MLSSEQTRALELFTQGKNLFLTGPAGTGKSMLIRRFMECASTRGKIQICAMTGTAARLLQCKARTLHSWSGMGIARGEMDEIIQRAVRNAHVRLRWRETQILIVDEVSMLSVKMLHIIHRLAQTIRGNQLPMGGLQVVFCGDFHQLAPIGTAGEEDTYHFCFETPLWWDIFPIQQHIVLKQVFRQRDPLFQTILSEIRQGDVSPESESVLQSHVGREINAGIYPTQILPTRHRVDAINQFEFNKLTTPTHHFTYQIVKTKRMMDGSPILTELMRKCTKMTRETEEREIESLLNNCGCEKVLSLKQGANVMITVNIDLEQGLTNGTQGRVEGFAEFTGAPQIRLPDGRVIQIPLYSWQSEDYPVLTIQNYPLVLAWAITIHKSQGSTLECASIDLGQNIFADGQSYVGLSRVQSLDGLYLTAFHSARIKTNLRVTAFYKHLEQKQL